MENEDEVSVSQKAAQITKNSLISLGVVGSIVTYFIGYGRLEAHVEALSKRADKMETASDAITAIRVDVAEIKADVKNIKEDQQRQKRR